MNFSSSLRAPSRARRRLSSSHGLRFEALEDRRLLAIDLTSPAFTQSPYDVNRDGSVTALDALVIINELTRNGTQLKSDMPQMRGFAAAATAASEDIFAAMDLNGDDAISPLDALMVINQLSELDGQVVRVRLEVTDLAGNSLTSLAAGQDFLLKGFVQDTRNLAEGGVFSAYFDVTFDPALASVVPGTLTFNAPYTFLTSGSTSTPGLINEVGGATQSLDPLGPIERQLFQVRMQALAGGSISFQADPSDVEDNEVLVYGESTPLNKADVEDGGNIEYVGVTLNVVPDPPVSISDAEIVEGNDGTRMMQFTVDVLVETDETVQVSYTTVNGTAIAGQDYQAVSGVLSFTAGVRSLVIQVPILGDLLNEADETFTVQLSNPVNASLSRATATGIIRNDDPLPSVSVGNADAFEGFDAVFQVQLSTASGQAVTINYNTVSGSATAGVDFQNVSGSLTIPAGSTTGEIRVPLIFDTNNEGAETFTLQFSVVNGTPSGTSASGTVRDVPPSSLSGYVYGDGNKDGIRQGSEPGLMGISIRLTGTDIANRQIDITVSTNSLGFYQFTNLLPGTYVIEETQPLVLKDGEESVGTQGGSKLGNDQIQAILGTGVDGIENNFGEGELTDDASSLENFFASSLNGRRD
jgi:hypothetical protein